MAGKFNMGRDATLQIVTAEGRVLQPAILTRFTYKQETLDLKSRPLNGRVINERNPDGWSGTFDFDRANRVLDDYFAEVEQDFYEGLRGASVYITHTIRELDRSVSQYRFMDCALQLSDGGTWAQDDKVTQRIDWMAGERRRIA